MQERNGQPTGQPTPRTEPLPPAAAEALARLDHALRPAATQ